MQTKIWGWVSICLSMLLGLWMMIAMPSFRGLDNPDAREAKHIILIAFLILSLISISSGVILVRKRD